MRRTYSNQEMTRILQQELVIPEQVEHGMQNAYMKLGIKLPKKTSFFRRRKALRVLAAAAVLAAGSSVVVFAANKLLSANLVKEQGTITYDLTVDHEQTAHEVEVTPTYMPEGYQLMDEEDPLSGKWHNNETGGSITIVSANAAELDKESRLGQIDWLIRGMKEENLKEELEINGMKVALFLSESPYADSDKTTANAMLFNEEEGYLVEIFNMDSHLPIEETIKIAEGLDIRVLDSTVPYATEEEINALLTEQKAAQRQLQAEMRPELLADNNFFSVGEELKIPFTAAEDGSTPDDIRYTVESIEIKDSLPASEYPSENYPNYDAQMAKWMNDDGSLKPHERFRFSRESTENPAIEPTIETVNSKFVVLHMKIKNHNKANHRYDDEFPVAPDVKYLSKDAAGSYLRDPANEDKYRPANENYDLQYGHPVYFDKMYYTEGFEHLKHAYFVPLEPGEEMEYTIAYVVDEDRLEDAFFQFYTGYDGWPVAEGKQEYVYVKAKQ